MGGLLKFSEAARLYAQYSAVVDTMYKAFEQNVDEFLDDLLEQIGKIVVPARLQERQTAGYRYWWLAQDNEDKDDHPQLWFSSRAVEIIVPGELRLTAVAPRADGEELRRLAAVGTQTELAPYCRPGSGGKWSLFTVIVSYPQEDPVDHAAKPIADVLIALGNAQEAQKSS